ncbi:AAA family ATPase [Candidatus Marithrix sp. Canyon 246]|uniref:AAA family ATPase n=1 Tax=Candidatus Marithrix sp. Canyon 246 TaxID=1827136 RepID=UPI00084A019D|nr:AAA family ATPase [Candidatus Marithrix sp. Canyon 246]
MGQGSALIKHQHTDLPEHPLEEDGSNLGFVLNNLQYQLPSQPIPAPRLSDGTLHYLFLMALLLDPNPYPLLCIEEPELGLHPDILPIIADMLIDASQRTQLIVTTHSDILISALSPENVVICERDDEGSHLRRLDPES